MISFLIGIPDEEVLIKEEMFLYCSIAALAVPKWPGLGNGGENA